MYNDFDIYKEKYENDKNLIDKQDSNYDVENDFKKDEDNNYNKIKEEEITPKRKVYMTSDGQYEYEMEDKEVTIIRPWYEGKPLEYDLASKLESKWQKTESMYNLTEEEIDRRAICELLTKVVYIAKMLKDSKLNEARYAGSLEMNARNLNIDIKRVLKATLKQDNKYSKNIDHSFDIESMYKEYILPIYEMLDKKDNYTKSDLAMVKVAKLIRAVEELIEYINNWVSVIDKDTYNTVNQEQIFEDTMKKINKLLAIIEDSFQGELGIEESTFNNIVETYNSSKTNINDYNKR